MSTKKHNIGGYTAKEAADIVGVSVGRIQQLARAGTIDHEYLLGRLIISSKGIEQAKKRRTTVGRPPSGKNGFQK
jgi:hypothetical protein